jgi:hypothetical protein
MTFFEAIRQMADTGGKIQMVTVLLQKTSQTPRHFVQKTGLRSFGFFERQPNSCFFCAQAERLHSLTR